MQAMLVFHGGLMAIAQKAFAAISACKAIQNPTARLSDQHFVVDSKSWPADNGQKCCIGLL